MLRCTLSTAMGKGTHMYKRVLTSAVALVSLSMAGCGASDEETSGAVSPPAASQETQQSAEPTSEPAAEAGSEACAEAFAAADADGDKKVTDKEILPAFSACASEDDWVATAADFDTTVVFNAGASEAPLSEYAGIRCDLADAVGGAQALDTPVCNSRA